MARISVNLSYSALEAEVIGADKFNINQQNLSGLPAWEVVCKKSICTGEMHIAFKNPVTGRLEQAQPVRTSGDIRRFYRAHGLKCPTKGKK